jgi:hypothetical protein
MNSKNLIAKLDLLPHPEGGWYRETWRSEETLTNKKGQIRNVCTAIYFLLEKDQISHFHRIQSDELWFFHQGQPLEIVIIVNGRIHIVTLGDDIEKGELPQYRIPANTWFAAKLKESTGYSLVSCTVAPGFDFSDFELATREALVKEFPHIEETIAAFTYCL